ncbi:MAG: 6-phosphofructokinase [Chloroflexi bacterium]|nr:6-phosphofructokinase [Chloroflexota bacterium]MCI0579848.1 6-phosphofructokinase [Chloroflexota bacterium]MCI0645673.1 6-phosphofructokinase [Chloroflexota bacterium]MCI0725585.1 6-phosphofructokinase [Chloroflexota bacterium]
MKRIGVFTSGGDAQGMNAAVRAVVRFALNQGVEVYAIYEGYQGMVDGGDRIRPIGWSDVGGILHQGGTVIGSARCAAFRERDGRKKAVRNLVEHGIDGLVVIGGDGSLTGASVLRQEWPELINELVAEGQISPEAAGRYPQLAAVGMVASIDNDMYGTDMTIGADTALQRITDAVDAISSTAASHQRTFVVEVMGRRCGYLALMGALASGADWVLIPESPPNLDEWEAKMCQVLAQGRTMGRRDSIVIVAEGARDRHGNAISSEYVKRVLEERLGEDTRVTILGHVQRGGSPSAFDRNLSTLLGAAAVGAILETAPGDDIPVIGMRGNKITRTPLSECLDKTRAVEQAIAGHNYELAMSLRSASFREAFQTLRTLVRALPHGPDPGQRRLRLAVMNAGAPAPGMNTAARAAVRLGLDRGHVMLGVYHGFQGLIDNQIRELDWMSVNGWALRGGSELGTNRRIPSGSDFYAIARNLEEHRIEGLLMIGGWSGYEAILELHGRRNTFPAFSIPMACLPATIDNDLPGSELSVGADTALNNIVSAVDKIKQSAVAARRAFVVEVMGQYCGYLALMSALATGAERVYLPEEGVTLRDLQADVEQLIKGFKQGKRLGMMIRNEKASQTYTTDFMCALFEEEGDKLFDVRTAILGHIQQGGSPTPFDRIMATRLAANCVAYLESQIGQEEPKSACIGLQNGRLGFTDLEDVPRMLDRRFRRPKEQWWLSLRPIARVLAQPGPEDVAV